MSNFFIDIKIRTCNEENRDYRTGQTYYVDLQLEQSKKAVLIPKGTFYSVTKDNG